MSPASDSLDDDTQQLPQRDDAEYPGEATAAAAAEATCTADASGTADGAPRKRLSPMVGAVCLAGGVLGLAVPGVPGWPLLLIGASVLAPNVPILARANQWMKEKFPEAHEGALKFEHRFLADFEKRFPEQPPAGGGTDAKS
ncbi:hypothetical protein DB346_07450 [Verrucomicrobia bacterium LW23]|nr:hypothetical protein DB346_07450 [Verrucomicrobia bacterium LW23]